MKWWYGIFVVVGVAVGGYFLRNYQTKKTVSMVERENLAEESKKLPMKLTFDSKGIEKQAAELVGVVQSWDPSNAILEIKAQEKIWQFTVDPEKATIFVPSKKNKEQILKVSESSGLRWEKAFCKDDLVSVRMDEGVVIFIDNGGYRSCGFKGE